MNKYINLIKNTGLFALANLSTKLISFVFLPIYTLYLTTEEYAIIDLSNVIQSLIWPILSISLSESLLRFCLDDKYKKEDIFTNSVIMIMPGIIIASIGFSLIRFNNLFNEYRYYLLAFYIIVSINSFLSIFVRTLEKMKLIVINSILSCLLISIFNVWFIVSLKMGVKGYFYSIIIGNLLSIISYLLLGKLYYYYNIKKFNRRICKELLKYSLPMIPNAIFWWINSGLDRFALTTLIGLSSVGLYSVSSKISSSLSIFTNIFSQAWNMSAFKEHGNKDYDSFYSNIFNTYNTILIIITILVILFSKAIATFMFANDFYEAWEYIPFLTIAFYFNGINVFLGSIFTANKKTNVIFYTTGLGAFFNIIFNYVFIRMFGIIGAAFATAISNMIVCIARFVKCRKYIQLKIRTVQLCFVIVLLCISSILRIKYNLYINILFSLVVILLDILYFVNYIKKERNKL